MELSKIIELVQQELNKTSKRIPIEASGRHIHLSQEDSDILFGKGYEFTVIKELSQPGQYACKERVRLVGPKGIIDGVVVLGPTRKNTQVELSLTDCKVLGIPGVLKISGDILGTPGLMITNGYNMIKLDEGVMVAKNHIHMTEMDAKDFNVKDGQLVKVKVQSNRPLIFEDVVVRVTNQSKLAMHIDYDEANACMLSKESYGELYE